MKKLIEGIHTDVGVVYHISEEEAIIELAKWEKILKNHQEKGVINSKSIEAYNRVEYYYICTYWESMRRKDFQQFLAFPEKIETLIQDEVLSGK